MKEDIINSFNRIALLDDKWDHNQHYEKLLISEISAKVPGRPHFLSKFTIR